ncbi:37S ribosomal protein SWS2, mitochondrial [Lachancea thermotolerans]
MVVHILGKGFKGKEVIKIALASKFYGIGLKTSETLCAKLGFYPWMRMHQLSEPQIMSITSELSTMTIEGNARAVVKENIALKRRIGSYQGMRHALNLPVRGQHTRNNAKTARRLNRVDRRGFHTFREEAIEQPKSSLRKLWTSLRKFTS